jgi:hypothetical protein
MLIRWHRSLKERIIQKEPSLFLLFKELQFIQNNTELVITQSFYSENKGNLIKFDLKYVCENYSRSYGFEILLKIASILKIISE